MFVTPFIPLILWGIFKEGITILRIPLLRIRRERGVMKIMEITPFVPLTLRGRLKERGSFGI